MHRTEVPQVGTLDGVRVVFAAPSIAGPFFGAMCADHGADVIWIEQASQPALDRSGIIGFLDADRKNMRNLALDIPSPDGRKIFLKLMKDTDIFLESSKGGTYEKWGLTDEILWEVNPRLVIIHVSGFGLTGDPNYIHRAAYDPIAQAFGGMMYTNTRGGPPLPASPVIADYYTGLFAFGSGLAAYIKALKTGKGDSVEVSQYEAVVRCMNYGFADWNIPIDDPNADKLRYKVGNYNNKTAGYNTYQCADGNYIFIMIIGKSVMQKAFPLLGLEYGSESTPEKVIYREYEAEGKILNDAIIKYCSSRTAEEVETVFSSFGIPAMRTLTFDDQLTHPHYVARETFTTVYNSEKGKDVIIPNIFPRMKNNPARIWRGAPSWGDDTTDILEDLGYSSKDIEHLAEIRVVHCKESTE